MKPLINNPKRQAVPILKGFSYQIWQSLLKWLDLRENQDLYLEGAEDFDVLGSATAETVQIKEITLTGPVTLRSGCVLEAINNFWLHQKNNPVIEIKFRLLTTAPRGIERPNVFKEKGGLDIWDSCRHPGMNNQALRDFLYSQDAALALDLRQFIKTCSNKDLRLKLLSRIEWDTGNKSQAYVEDLVRRKVIEYGDRTYNLPPSECEKVVPYLLQYVWGVVLSKDRFLTRSDFLLEFQEAITQRIPVHELRKLQRLAEGKSNQDLPGRQSGVGNFNFDKGLFEVFSFPDTSKLAERESLVDKFLKKLNQTNVLVLTGSTSLGKSQLAFKIVGASLGESENTWRKLDFRSVEPEQIKERLNYAAEIIENNPHQIDCLIDDLNFNQRPSVYENALGRLLYAIKMRNGRVLMTSHQKLPSRLANLLDISAGCFVTVPRLNEEDIKDLLRRNNCPSGHRMKAWSRLISRKYQGHPLLTHTRVRSLANENWHSNPTNEDITAINEEIKDVRKEFRRNLRDHFSENARNLLYRLSIFPGRFKRRQALVIGRFEPRLTEAADDFDELVGPCIEQVDTTYFRLSPMLENTSTEVFTEAEIKNLHKTAAESLLEPNISVIELNGILFHGLLGEALEPLAVAASCIFGVSKSEFEEIAQFCSWFAYAGLASSKILIPNSLLVNFMLRRVQFKIMSIINPIKAVEVANIIEIELRSWQGAVSYSGEKAATIFQFLNDVIFELAVPFEEKRVANWILEIISIQKSAPEEIFPDHPEHQNTFKEKYNFLSGATMYIRAAVGRCRTPESVINLLDAFDSSSEANTAEVWLAFRNDNLMTSILTDAVWLSEIRIADPDRNWEKCLQTLNRVIEISIRQKADSLTAAAYKAKAIIYEEYVKEPDSAFKELANAEEQLGTSQIFIDDYRAKTFFLEKNYGEAIAIWRKILPLVATDRNAARAFSYRDAEICAARLGDWREAADFALSGEEAARLPWVDEPVTIEVPKNDVGENMALGFRADYGFAFWKLNEKAKTVEIFAEVLDAFQYLPKSTEDLRVLMLQKRVEYALAWFLKDLDNDKQFIEPQAGFFSNPEKTEEVANYPVQPVNSQFYLLAKLEYRLRLGTSILQRLEGLINIADNNNISLGYYDLVVRQALRKPDLENLIPAFLSFSESIQDYKPETEEGDIGPWDEVKVIKYLTFTALTIYLSRGQHHLLPISQWRKEYTATQRPDQMNESFNNWLNLFEEYRNADNGKLGIALQGLIGEDEQIISALIISAAQGINAETRFYANVILLSADFSQTWRSEIIDIIEFWVVENWKRIASNEMFLLQNPEITAPLIVAACDDNTFEGRSKVANVLLAASGSVRLNISEDIFDELRKLITIT